MAPLFLPEFKLCLSRTGAGELEVNLTRRGEAAPGHVQAGRLRRFQSAGNVRLP
jgi:hypothetical protein